MNIFKNQSGTVAWFRVLVALFGVLVALLTALLSCFYFGYEVGKDANIGLATHLKLTNATLEEVITKQGAENDALRADLQRSLDANVESKGQECLAADSASHLLRVGESVVTHQGEIVIALVGISFGGSPLRHKVHAIVGTRGGANQVMRDADVGEAILVNNLEIRIVFVNSLGAGFLIVSLDEKATPTAAKA